LSTNAPAKVYLDETIIGPTPLDAYTVSAGKHRVRLECTECPGTSTIEFTIDVLSGQDLRQRHNFQLPDANEPAPPTPQAPGYLHINSMPWAKISVDGVYLRDTPLVGYEVAPGEHRIVLERPGYGQQIEFFVQVRPGQTVKQVFAFPKGH